MAPVSEFLNKIKRDQEAAKKKENPQEVLTSLENRKQTTQAKNGKRQNGSLDASLVPATNKRQKKPSSDDNQVSLTNSSSKQPSSNGQHPGGKNKRKSNNSKPPANFPQDLYKYWYARYNLFSLFDYGIQLSPTMWFSVTPENVARVIANQTALRYPRAKSVLDAFGGAGGNTIQFAMEFEKVIYFDIDKENVEMSKNNCLVYDVLLENDDDKDADEHQKENQKRKNTKDQLQQDNDFAESQEMESCNAKEYHKNNNIEFYKADFFKFQYPPTLENKQNGKQAGSTSLQTNKNQQKEKVASTDTTQDPPRFTRDDVVFLSPPWGGVAYSQENVWSLSKCEPYSIQSTVKRAREAYTDNIVLYLPRNSDLDELLSDKDIFPDPDDKKKIPGFYLTVQGRCKALIVFLGSGLEPLKCDIYK